MKLNIELPRVSGGPIGVAYSATEGLGWAHREWNIELRRVSGGLIEAEY